MDIDEFRKNAHELVDWIANYYKNIEDYPVLSQSGAGEIYRQLADSPPDKPERFEEIIKDFDDIILPGVTHWQHPKFFGYFPANSSFPSILGEMLTSALGVQGMIWQTSPAAAELEEMMMDWLKQMIGLPEEFEGVIQDTASTSTLVSILTAREYHSQFDINSEGLFNSRYLTVYCSAEAHSSIDKAVKIAGIGSNNLRRIAVDENFAMKPEALKEAIESDLNEGYKPLAVILALGTTSSTAVDNIKELGEIAKNYDLWVHVDAAYAGTALVLPEYKHLLEGIELVDTFVFNPHKWMMTNFDLSAYYVRDKEALIRTFEIHPEYLKTEADPQVNNYRDWGIQLGRRFRALKLWFVLRSYGVEGIKIKIKSDIEIAKEFTQWIKNDPEFELVTEPLFNLVCFRYIPEEVDDEDDIEEINKRLLNKINSSGKMFITHTRLNDKLTLRFVCGQTNVNRQHVKEAWDLIKTISSDIH